MPHSSPFVCCGTWNLLVQSVKLSSPNNVTRINMKSNVTLGTKRGIFFISFLSIGLSSVSYMSKTSLQKEIINMQKTYWKKFYFKLYCSFKKYLLIRGSSPLSSSRSEFSNKMHGVLVFDAKVSPKWQKITRYQWDLTKRHPSQPMQGNKYKFCMKKYLKEHVP